MQVSFRPETGQSKFTVFMYTLRRRPGQGMLLSQSVIFGGRAAPRGMRAADRATQVHP